MRFMDCDTTTTIQIGRQPSCYYGSFYFPPEGECQEGRESKRLENNARTRKSWFFCTLIPMRLFILRSRPMRWLRLRGPEWSGKNFRKVAQNG